MTDIILHGASGRMGKVIRELCAADEDCRIVAGVDVFGEGDGSFPFFSELSACDDPADVITHILVGRDYIQQLVQRLFVRSILIYRPCGPVGSRQVA